MNKRWVKIWATAWALIAVFFGLGVFFFRLLIYLWITDCEKYGQSYFAWSMFVPLVLIAVCLTMLLFDPAREMIRQIERKDFRL